MKSFFEPKSIAVAGVSADSNKLGSIIFAKLLANSEKGLLKASVYALNPARTRIGDRPCYPSISALPEVPELLIVAVPVSMTLDLVREATAAGVRAMVLVTSGYAEAGRTELERRIGALAAASGTRVLGPNTIGLVDTTTGVDSLFLRPTKTLPDGSEIVSALEPRKGGVALITQSGYLGQMITEELTTNAIGIRAMVGTGNQLDVSVEDVIRYFADDAGTRVISVYLEGVSDGRRFMSAASYAARRKPLVVFKVGKTVGGAKAAFTHTASLVGDYDVYRAAFRQSGVIEAGDLQELVDLSISFSLLPTTSKRDIVIVTNAGGVGAIAADEAERCGLHVAPLSAGAEKRLRSELSDTSFISNSRLGNPLDLTATASTDEFVRVTRLALGLPEYGLSLVLPTHQTPAIGCDISELLSGVVLESRKPVAMCVMGESPLAARIHQDFTSKGIPSFPSPERGVRALAAIPAYESLSRAARSPLRLPTKGTKGGKPSPLSLRRISALLKSHGIAEPKSTVVHSESGLREASELGFPVVCKLLSRDLPHKSDAGGVVLDVRSIAELSAALEGFRRISTSKRIRFDGMLVQEMVEGGQELILGANRDPVFGPTVLVGIGGRLTEVLGEFALAIAPITSTEARALLSNTNLSRLLGGYRGGPRADIDRLAAIISRFSRILMENGTVDQLEINPLIVTDHGFVAADVRGVSRGPGR